MQPINDPKKLKSLSDPLKKSARCIPDRTMALRQDDHDNLWELERPPDETNVVRDGPAQHEELDNQGSKIRPRLGHQPPEPAHGSDANTESGW